MSKADFFPTMMDFSLFSLFIICSMIECKLEFANQKFMLPSTINANSGRHVA